MKKLMTQERIIHSQFRQYGRNAREWLRKCRELLPFIAEYRIWEKKGFSSIYHYAAELASMSKSMVDDALWIQRAIIDKPALQRVAEEKGLYAIRPVLGISAADGRVDFWAEKAGEMSRHALEQYVRDYRRTFRTGSKIEPVKVDERARPISLAMVRDGMSDVTDVIIRSSGEPITPGAPLERVELELSPMLARKLETLKNNKKFLKMLVEMVEKFESTDVVGSDHGVDRAPDEIEHVTDADEVSDKVADVIATDKMRDRVTSVALPIKPDPVSTTSRHIPVAIRRYVKARARERCEFSGCSKPHEIFHHTQRWELEHIHDPEKIVALCKEHERIVHHGLVDNEDHAPSAWRVREYADFSDRRFYVDSLVMAHRGWWF